MLSYKIRVTYQMRVWGVSADDAEEIESLGPGIYFFIAILAPLHGTDGYWIVVKEDYERGRTVGRHMRSLTTDFSKKEGWEIEEEIRDQHQNS